MTKFYVVSTDGRTAGPFENPNDAANLAEAWTSGSSGAAPLDVDDLPPTFTAAPVGLRDQFAMAALTGMATSAGFQGAPWKNLAKDAYEAADAMLKQREKNDG